MSTWQWVALGVVAVVLVGAFFPEIVLKGFALIFAWRMRGDQ